MLLDRLEELKNLEAFKIMQSVEMQRRKDLAYNAKWSLDRLRLCQKALNTEESAT